MKNRVLSTKKLDPALIQKAADAGILITEKEMIRVTPLTGSGMTEQIMRYKGHFAVFTSAAAVEAILGIPAIRSRQLKPEWKIFTLSGKTARAVHTLPAVEVISAAAGNAAELANEIIHAGIPGIVFFCGTERRDELPRILQQAGVRVHEVVVYKTEPAPTVTGDGFDAVLFFSPSGVSSFFSVNPPVAGTLYVAIGGTTAAEIRKFTGNKIRVTDQPRPELMLELLLDYFKLST